MVKLPKPFDAELWTVENAIREKRRPPTDELISVLQRQVATPLIYQYLANLNEGPPFVGRKPLTIDKIVERMELAVEQIRAEQVRAKKNGQGNISLTEAVNRAAKSQDGLNKNILWEMVALYKAHNDTEDI